MAGPPIVDKQSQRTTSSITQVRRKPDFGTAKRKKKRIHTGLRKKKRMKPTEITIIRLGTGG